MKKIIISSLILLSITYIYINNQDKKIYYLSLGDSLATYQKQTKGYPYYVSKYLKEKNILEKHISKFSQNGQRTTDLINNINQNKKITQNKNQITIQNALIKADLITISIGANDILSKIKNKNLPYDYIDELTIDLDKLLKLIRKYCKEKIILVGYYDPYNTTQSKQAINYLNKKYKQTAKKYNIKYLEINTIFQENPEFIPSKTNIHPSKAGYKAIAGEIISNINKTLIKS